MLTNRLREFQSFIDRDQIVCRGKTWLIRAFVVWGVLMTVLTLFLIVPYSMLSVKAHKIAEAKKIIVLESQHKNPYVVGMISDNEIFYQQGGDIYFRYLSSFSYVAFWLQSIVIHLNEHSISISGHMLSPTSIHYFIAMLKKKNSPFHDWVIVSTDIQAKDKESVYDFTVILKNRSHS